MMAGTGSVSASSSTKSSILHFVVNHGLKSSGCVDSTSTPVLRLIDFIANQLHLSKSEAKELIHVGAVYYLPHTLGALSTSNLATASSTTRQPQPKRISSDCNIYDQDYIRVHPHPRRYPNAKQVDWSKRIVFESPDYFVIDKPNGVPSHATMDNRKDNVLECIRNLMKRRENDNVDSANSSCEDSDTENDIPLYLPQRLDVETSGLMLIARNSVMIRLMSDWLKRDLIQKRYKALVAFTVHAKDSEEVHRIQQSIFGTPSSTMKLAGHFCEGDIMTSYLKKTTVAPKFYYWNSSPTIKDHPLQSDIATGESLEELQDCHSKIISISPPIIKSKYEWIVHANSIIDSETTIDHKDMGEFPSENIFIFFFCAILIFSNNLDRRKVNDAIHMWMKEKSLYLDEENAHSLSGERKAYIGFQEVVLELITGRTHQVRGQLQSLQWHPEVIKHNSFIGRFHIAGDNLYTGATCFAPGGADLEDSDDPNSLVSRSCPHLALQVY